MREKQHETIYIPGIGGKPIVLKKWKGFAVTAVAWNPTATDAGTTKDIVVGTDQGVIYEAEIVKHDKYIKPLFRLEIPKPEPISSIHMVPMPKLRDRDGHQQWFFIVATARHCFQIIGPSDPASEPVFQPVFARKNANRRYFQVVQHRSHMSPDCGRHCDADS